MCSPVMLQKAGLGTTAELPGVSKGLSGGDDDDSEDWDLL